MCSDQQGIGVQRPGGYAEKIVVREAKYLVDAEGIDTFLAGSYACSGLTAYSALKKLGPLHDEWIAIIGLGGVGLMGLAIAKGTGFEKVAVIDIDDAKLEIAADEYGADTTFNAKSSNVVEAVTSDIGHLAGVVDFVGSGDTFGQAAGLLRGLGVSVTVGLFGGELRFPLPALAVQQLQFRGSFVGTLAEFEELMAFVRTGAIKPIPTTPVPFTEVNARMKSCARAASADASCSRTHKETVSGDLRHELPHVWAGGPAGPPGSRCAPVAPTTLPAGARSSVDRAADF